MTATADLRAFAQSSATAAAHILVVAGLRWPRTCGAVGRRAEAPA
jgi:hypothetical protein